MSLFTPFLWIGLGHLHHIFVYNMNNNNKKTTAILKSLDIVGAILLVQFSCIEQHVGLDCGIE